MDGENNGKPWKTLLKWMIWGYAYSWKHPIWSLWSPSRPKSPTFLQVYPLLQKLVVLALARVRVQRVLALARVQVLVQAQVSQVQVQVQVLQVQVQVLQVQLVLLRGLELLLHRVQEMKQERVPVAKPMRHHAKDLGAPFQEISSTKESSMIVIPMGFDPQAWCQTKVSVAQKPRYCTMIRGTLISTMDISKKRTLSTGNTLSHVQPAAGNYRALHLFSKILKARLAQSKQGVAESSHRKHPYGFS